MLSGIGKCVPDSESDQAGKHGLAEQTQSENQSSADSEAGISSGSQQLPARLRRPAARSPPPSARTFAGRGSGHLAGQRPPCPPTHPAPPAFTSSAIKRSRTPI